jgi:hypothetical protein
MLRAQMEVPAVAAPLILTGIAIGNFRAREARVPLPTAITFTANIAVLDAGVVADLGGTWLPFMPIFRATWVTDLRKVKKLKRPRTR